jgi:capsular polysaccharide biosynthesis protein
MVSTIKSLLTRMYRPSVHWSPVLPAGDPVAGGRLVAPGLGRASRAAWQAPVVLGAAPGSVTLAEPIGTSDRSLVVFDGARLIDQNGVIELRDGSLLAEPAWHPNVVNPWLDRRQRPVRSRRMRGAWFSCLLEFSYNYYHWICEVLPRFHAVLERLPAEVRFVVPESMAEWQWDSLDALGVLRARCAQLPRGEAWACDALYYAGPVAACGDHDPRAVEWLRSRATAALGAAGSGRDRLYITRRLTRRSIVNEAEHWPLFADAGFTMIEAERMTFAEQVRAFSSASIVVAPHGAGSANVMWCAPPATVVEIFSPSFATQRCGWTLASAAGHRYAVAVAEDAGTPALDLRWNAPLVRQMLDWAGS